MSERVKAVKPICPRCGCNGYCGCECHKERLEAAILAERERCAKIADNVYECHADDSCRNSCSQCLSLKAVADAIRRGEGV